MLTEFYSTCIFHHVWEENLKFMIFTFLENVFNLGIFDHSPVPHLKLQAKFSRKKRADRKEWRKL